MMTYKEWAKSIRQQKKALKDSRKIRVIDARSNIDNAKEELRVARANFKLAKSRTEKKEAFESMKITPETYASEYILPNTAISTQN